MEPERMRCAQDYQQPIKYMIEPIVSLAFSIYSNRGAYALLLGSGTSRASGIPTGWEVVLDLIRKVAKLEDQNCEPDPAVWFKAKHGVDPDYSKLLDAIAKTPSERQQLLRSYFEPTEDERSQGLKSPSLAHKMIAKLVVSGYIRVLVTTNFDRLIESALAEAGVSPTVISTADQVSGALPLAHSGITIIKLHGDYLDTRLKNTQAELASYDPSLSSLLDRVIDEYGLIVCGWSADWDVALRTRIESCSSRRFTTFWATRSQLSDRAKRLVEHRRAEVIQIRDADYFFQQVSEKVQALSDLAKPHPLSAKIAVATLKRYLPDSAARIRLRDLLFEETEKLIADLDSPAFPPNSEGDAKKELIQRLSKYEGLCETLLAMYVTGCFWGEQGHAKLWIDCLERVANSAKSESGVTYLINLKRYPALLLLYAGGIAAVAAGNYQNFASLVLRAKAVNRYRNEKAPICSVIYPSTVMEGDVGKLLPEMEQRYTPISDYLFAKLRSCLRDFLPGDEEYLAAFDRFEYLFGLVHADLNRQERGGLGITRNDGHLGEVGRTGFV